MDGSCDINPRTRKDCTRCRFQKCLHVGMRPDLVTNPAASNTQQVSSASTSDGGDQSMAMMVNYHQNPNFHNPNYHHNSNPSSMAPVQSSLVRRSISESIRINNLNYLLNHNRIQCNRSANFSTHTNPNHSIYNPNYSNHNLLYSQSSLLLPRHLMDDNPNQVRNPYQTILSRNQTITRMNRSQFRYPNQQSLVKDMNSNQQSLMRQSCDLNQKIPRPEIPIIDTHIQGLTLNEKIKLYEMITVVHSTLLTPEDCSRFIGDTRTDLNTMTCIFISRVIRALNRLKAAEYLEYVDREILLKGSVGKIIFLRSIPQFDHVNKCWIVYKNPVSIPFPPNWTKKLI